MKFEQRQKIEALRAANIIRVERAKLKAELNSMPSHEALFLIADLIETRGKFESMRVGEILKASRSVGKVHAQKVLGIEISQERRLREIAPSTRQRIAWQVRALADERRKRLEREQAAA